VAETQVNPQITDAITQTNVKVVGESPAQSLGLAYQALSHSTGLAMENAMQTQAGMQQIAASATSVILKMIVQAGA